MHQPSLGPNSRKAQSVGTHTEFRSERDLLKGSVARERLDSGHRNG